MRVVPVLPCSDPSASTMTYPIHLPRMIAAVAAFAFPLPSPAQSPAGGGRAPAPTDLERLAGELARDDVQLRALLARLAELGERRQDDAFDCGAYLEELHTATRLSEPIPLLPSKAELAELLRKRTEAFAQERNVALLEGLFAQQVTRRARAWTAIAVAVMPARPGGDELYRVQQRFTTGRRGDAKAASETFGACAVDLVRIGSAVLQGLVEREAAPATSMQHATAVLAPLFARLDELMSDMRGDGALLAASVDEDERLQLMLVTESGKSLVPALAPWRPGVDEAEPEGLELQQALIAVVTSASDLDRSLRQLMASWGSEAGRKPLAPLLAVRGAAPKQPSAERNAQAHPLQGWIVGTQFDGTREGRNRASDPSLIVRMRGRVVAASEDTLVLEFLESWHVPGQRPVTDVSSKWTFRVNSTDARRGRTTLECSEQEHDKGPYSSVRGDAVLTSSTLSGDYYHEWTGKDGKGLKRPFGLRNFELTRLVHASFAVGSQWVNEDGKDQKTRTWKVLSVSGERITFEKPSIQKKGVVRFTLDITADGKVEVVSALHVDTNFPVESRKHRGSGTFADGRIVFDFEAEQKVHGEPWTEWRHERISLRPME